MSVAKRYKHSDDPKPNTVIVDRLTDRFDLDIVLYTRIGANIDNPDPETLAGLAISSVSGAGEGRDGITYLMNAMNAGIKTPLTAGYAEAIKRLCGADDLAGALARTRAPLKT